MSYDRNLGQLEQAMEVLNARAKTWNVVTISRIKGCLEEDILRSSLHIIQCRHPRLNSRIVSLKNKLAFQTKGTHKIPLRVVKILNCEQWTEVFNEEMNHAIPSSKYLIRAVLVQVLSNPRVNFLITTAHHAIADGLSCIQLHSEILTYYQKFSTGEAIQPLINLTPLPPIEKLIPQSKQGLKGKISSLLFLLNVAFQKVWYRPDTLGFEKYLPIAKRYSEIVHRQLNEELTQQFINRCRQENTTVNSALCAAMMFAVAQKLIKENKKNLRLSCLTYLDLRKHIKPAVSDENMAVLATSNMGLYSINKTTSFWQVAREVKQNLDVSIKQGNIFKMILIAKYLMDFCFIYPKKVAATVSVSNVGKVNIPKVYGELELEEISFAGTHALYGGVFILHTSTFQGKMLLNFVCSRPSISEETMEALVNNFISYILNVSHSQYNHCLFDIQEKDYYPVKQ
ncbi:phthiocerol/phthiodiolone dimycocerosyl transferase family protein [Nostoc sp. UHCC 0870]|uniref:phthiocerol/phthiodiolone dimycocerosyl transferase family protein n=1 Tax=Nostoc sp. UHCC 0870 TaxID=2914041 RepID=UPI001EE00DE4|nr:condensation domain-containing protein [Nostoc sp. UHCC 0870]UKO98788.1 condensation domain-containing protein [Nostoc sp. UHCC 0870]